MSAQNRALSDIGTGILGFVGLSALAGVLVTAAVTPALAVTGMAANNGISMFENLPGYLDVGELSEKTDIYATQADGSALLLASFFDENREEVPWESISQYVKDAAIAGEDPRFYEHGGVDIQGTIRGALSTYVLNQDVQGGSSITQQYVKNVLINNGIREAETEEEKEAAYDAATETSPERKLKEMRYAIALEKKFSKDDILRGYLNIAAFGGRVYGIESAAQYYFAKHASDVTLAEAASLIAIVNHPEKFRLDYPESETNGAATVVDGQPVPYADNKERRDYILGEMLKEKKITQEEHDVAVATPVTPIITEPSTGCQTANGSAYFCDYVTWVIKNQFDDPATADVDEGVQLLQQGGLQVYTTLDLELQSAAETAIAENVPFVDDRFNVGSVAVTVQPGTGRILAMAQNKKYSNDPDVLAASAEYSAVNYSTDFNYGGSSGLQPGSTYKVFTLAEWLNSGHSLRETFNGARRGFSSFTDSCNGNWSGEPYNPRNDDGRIANNAVDATKWSVNSSFMAMAQQLDLCKIKQTAQAFGIHRADNSDLQMNPSDVLGTQEIAPVTMAAAFAGIANNGLTCTPIAIDKIVKADGTEVPPPASACTQSVTPEVAHAMAYAMQQTFTGDGTARASNTGTGIAHIGKTGTTDGAKDTWMIGASTKAATAVWVGNVVGAANLRDLEFESGDAATARHRIWPMIMEVADNKFGGDDFPEADDAFFKQVLVDVPQVVGLSLEEAKKALESAGFIFEDGGQQDSNLPQGTVSGTDPSGQAARGANIRVFTSNGSGTTVPDLTGMTQPQAKAALDQAGLKMKTSGNIDPTAVVESQDPAPNTAIKRGETVTVAFSGAIGGNPPGGDSAPGDG
ncbi:transglycosylase domain-containing protein [Agromyces sp. NPDC049794]|uniref:transglycosylase domain-containing protein n=1 Tax=unclassified Agromyces TaxID=2639701 RepID=UPI0033D68CEE